MDAGHGGTAGRGDEEHPRSTRPGGEILRISRVNRTRPGWDRTVHVPGEFAHKQLVPAILFQAVLERHPHLLTQ